MADELNRMLNTLAERGSPRGADSVLDDAYRDAEIPAREPDRRQGWRRNSFAFAGGLAAAILAVGGVAMLLQRTLGEDDPVTGTEPATIVTTDGGPTTSVAQVSRSVEEEVEEEVSTSRL